MYHQLRIVEFNNLQKQDDHHPLIHEDDITKTAIHKRLQGKLNLGKRRTNFVSYLSDCLLEGHTLFHVNTPLYRGNANSV